MQAIKKFPYERLRQIAKCLFKISVKLSPVYGQKDCLLEQI
jgi:hypothetical protein